MSDQQHTGVRVEACDASGMRLVVVAARFNEFVTDKLARGASQAIVKQGGDVVDVVWVPGAFELPVIAQEYALRSDIDAVVAIGCVIRGDTSHYDYVCSGVTNGIVDVGLKTRKPIAFGVLTTDNEAQAQARCTDDNNKGAEAALTAIEMVHALRKAGA